MLAAFAFLFWDLNEHLESKNKIHPLAGQITLFTEREPFLLERPIILLMATLPFPRKLSIPRLLLVANPAF